MLVPRSCVAITNCSSRLILECPVGINAKVKYFIVLFILRVPVRIIIIEDGTLHNAVTCASRERAHTFFFFSFKFTFSVQLSLSRLRFRREKEHVDAPCNCAFWMAPPFLSPSVVQTTLAVRSNRKIRFASFTNAITDSINPGVIVDETSANRKIPHEEEINFPSEIYFLPPRWRRERGKNVSARLNKWLLNNFLLRNFYLYFAIFRYCMRYCLRSVRNKY